MLSGGAGNTAVTQYTAPTALLHGELSLATPHQQPYDTWGAQSGYDAHILTTREVQSGYNAISPMTRGAQSGYDANSPMTRHGKRSPAIHWV